MKTLLIRFSQFSLGALGSALLNLIMLPVTTYFLTPEEYGKTSMFFLAQTLLTYFIYLGFDQAFTREFHEYPVKKALLKQAMAVPLIGALVIIIFSFLLARPISFLLFADAHYTHAVELLAFSSLFLIFERFILLFLRMKNQAIRFSIYSIVVKLMVLLGTLLALFVGPRSFITVVYGMLFGQIAGDLLLIVLHIDLFRKAEAKWDVAFIKQLAKFGFPIVIGTFLYSLLIILDKVFLRMFSGFHELGIYTAAFKVASALMILQVSFANFWVPTAYEWFQEKKPISYYETVSHFVMLAISVAFLGLLFFKRWFIWILSPAYLDAQYIFPLLTFYPLMMTVSETTNLGIVFSKRSSLNIYVSLVAVFVATICNLFLIPVYGALGAAIATGTGYIFFFLTRTYFSMRNWEGFPVKRHIWTTLILYLLALNSAFFREIWLEKIFILMAFVWILFLYRNEWRMLLQLTKKGLKI
ncbi:lipopolysaccharide biosynthesis protein [Listeria kieliensis]|uniref:Polysaccharide biosynthesis protein n=1 Tax=Listeria kieliensis TaxID=1621700 RepID=A0A3D8TUD1_9LIST|nr:oligosaccharide flippase family protein [Listeria kieliensis]RDX02257.1 polysaccharide biosynthesis protein [Listeria kieliensis]